MQFFTHRLTKHQYFHRITAISLKEIWEDADRISVEVEEFLFLRAEFIIIFEIASSRSLFLVLYHAFKLFNDLITKFLAVLIKDHADVLPSFAEFLQFLYFLELYEDFL